MVDGVHGSAKNREPVKGMPDDRILMLFLIEFPMNGTYSFAFITGEPNEEINKNLKGNFVNVYVPTTTNPTSGYTLIVPKNKPEFNVTTRANKLILSNLLHIIP